MATKKEYMTAKDFEKPDPMEQARQMMQQAMGILPQPEHCNICHKILNINEPYIEYYDKVHGVIRVCRACTVRSVDYYLEVVGPDPKVQ